MALEVIVYTVEARKAGETDREAFHTEQAPYPHGEFYTYDYQEAKGYAQEHKLIVIANEYEFADSEPLDDYSEIPGEDEG